MAIRQKVRAPVQRAFPFMKLPAELRLRIYREVLHTEQEIIMDPAGIYDRDELLPYDLCPNILQTCRQVHDEAVEVLYGENVFMTEFIDHHNSNASRVKRGSAYIVNVERLTEFLHDHPNLTHLILSFHAIRIEMEAARVAVETALRLAIQGQNRLTNLEICVEHLENPLSSESIDFCWRLYSIVWQNRAIFYGARPEKTEHDAPAAGYVFPPFVKVYQECREFMI